MGPELLSQELLSQGLQLMLIGMGTVFSFLIFLVCVTHVMSWVIQRIEPVQGPYAQMAGKFGVDELHVEAIVVALDRHRSHKGGCDE
jgi:oxaloacetate decarboxylase gamma subunit